MQVQIGNSISSTTGTTRVTSPIVVTGGNGTLGKHVVGMLRERGYGVRIVSRHTPAAATDDGLEFAASDLSTGAGAEAAVDGAEVIVHCAGSSNGDAAKAEHLVRAASRAGARHIVYISVVGADRVPVQSKIDRAMFGYFESKLGAERVVERSGIPWTTLRATQFHDLMLMAVSAMARLPVIPVPARMRFQPVDTAEVAARLVELALEPPAGLVPDIAGPHIYLLADLVRSYLRAQALRRPIVPLWLPGKAASAIRAGANLAPDQAVGRRTWEDFLANRVQ